MSISGSIKLMDCAILKWIKRNVFIFFIGPTIRLWDSNDSKVLSTEESLGDWRVTQWNGENISSYQCRIDILEFVSLWLFELTFLP